MKSYHKKTFPVSNVRRFLEPGPIVLLSSKWREQTNIMTMGWHTVMEFTPSLVGCIISNANYSFDLIRKSKECVINIPTADMIKSVTGIGTTSGKDTDKFEKFRLTATDGRKVDAPLIKECYANFECRIHDASMVKKYNYFIFEVVAAHVASSPKFPKSVHYRGDGIFMVSGRHLNFPSLKGY